MLTSNKANAFCFFPTVPAKSVLGVGLVKGYEILQECWVALQQHQMHVFRYPHVIP